MHTTLSLGCPSLSQLFVHAASLLPPHCHTAQQPQHTAHQWRALSSNHACMRWRCNAVVSPVILRGRAVVAPSQIVPMPEEEVLGSYKGTGRGSNAAETKHEDKLRESTSPFDRIMRRWPTYWGESANRNKVQAVCCNFPDDPVLISATSGSDLTIDFNQTRFCAWLSEDKIEACPLPDHRIRTLAADCECRGIESDADARWMFRLYRYLTQMPNAIAMRCPDSRSDRWPGCMGMMSYLGHSNLIRLVNRGRHNIGWKSRPHLSAPGFCDVQLFTHLQPMPLRRPLPTTDPYC
ncbi:uncharacterized protein B0T15DRAFT_118551 [Chaetomium strumarium]|uniref:Uncharacterized protein n=1 Tax=Chaetomium strumarium TaxID=1170767 RepID=A0AAJ0GZ20_9PEZI|nr:hypothetical protein B0T15DRAFT_118551 [Chaetomium strumarium]